MLTKLVYTASYQLRCRKCLDNDDDDDDDDNDDDDYFV